MNKIANIKIPIELQQLIGAELAHHFGIVPKSTEDTKMEFYITEEGYSEEVRDELELYIGKEINFEYVSSEVIKKALFEYYRHEDSNNEPGKLTSPRKGFLEDSIYEAKSIGSSDIHFEVYEDGARARFRIDGHLIEKYKIPKEEYLELVNKIKIESNLDITEKRLPQDGRINYADFDIRVSILPTLHGEKVVMRLLRKDTSHLDLEQVGFDPEELNLYLEGIRKSNGIVLISGPTGSGKTTTLYATLKRLNDNKRNIVTIEDPIEYTLKGINQVQLKENIGLSFASALRSFLRQDPDIIMLGEIRDAETAKMAIRASLTGHLVLSTIHTNSALGTISRLIDMGVPSFYIAETLNVSVAQRLVRTLCDSCKEKKDISKAEFPIGYKPPYQIPWYYAPKGCPKCYYTGYKGRRAIYELVPIKDEVIKTIKRHPQNLKEKITLGYKKLSDKAYDALAEGETSLEEIYSLLINN